MISKQSPEIQDLNKTKTQLISELEQWRSGRLQAGNSNSTGFQGGLPAQLIGFLQIADVAVILTDDQFRIQLFSAGAESTFGFTFAEVLEQPIDMLLPAGARERHRRHLESFATGDDVLRLMSERSEVYGQRKNGQKFPAEASITKISVEGKTHFAVMLRDITERKRAEEELLLNVEIVQNMAEGVHLIRAEDGILVYANPKFEQMFGYDPGEMLGMPMSRLNAPGKITPKETGEEIGRIMAEQGRWHGEVYSLKKDGTKFWCNVTASAFEDSRYGKVWVAVQEDITERKRAEEELQAKENLLQTVFAAIPVGVQVKDRQGRYLMTNEAFAANIGLPPEMLKGLTVEDIGLGTPQQRKIIEADDRKVMESGERVEAWDEELTLPNGKTIWRHKIKAPLLDHAGTTIGLVGVIEDVTKRKEAELARAEGERLLRLLTDAVPVSICYIDRDERYRFNNRTMCEWIGRDADTLHGKRVGELMSPEAYRIIQPHIEQVLAGEIHSYESEVPFPDGNTRYFHASYIPDIGPDGQVRGFSSMVEDITERKKMEEQLRESQKMEAVGQLAGGIAHEFNNAMQIISNSAYFIQHKPENTDSVVEYADMIAKSAERTSRLTQQLLGFSRKSIIQKKILHLGELVSSQVGMVSRLIGEQILVEHGTDDDLDLVNADPGIIEQVIINLCVNARDAMPGGGRLTIESKNFIADPEFCDAHGLGGAGRFVVLSVSDNGVGISPKNRQHIFEPFFTTKEVGKGTGLGLAMVYGAIQQHGGVIEVFSEPEAGSTFKIFLPAVKSEEINIPQHIHPASPRGSETVLIAEDDDEVRTMLSRLLESQGYVVFTAKDGMDTLDIFTEKQNLIDLVILDMVMPRKHGQDVYKQIRQTGSDVPVLFSSGYSPNELESDFLSENELRLIKKPYSPNQLFTIVREILDLR